MWARPAAHQLERETLGPAKRKGRGNDTSTRFGSGSWIRTNDLRVMSPTSYHCSIPRRVRVRSHYVENSRESRDGPGTGLLSHAVAHAVSLALGRFTTVFGKGTGGTTPLGPPGPPLDPHVQAVQPRAGSTRPRRGGDAHARTRGPVCGWRGVGRSCRRGVVHEGG